MKTRYLEVYFLLIIFLFATSNAFSQLEISDHVTFKSRIVDAISLESIPDATLVNLRSKNRSQSNSEGLFTMRRSASSARISINYIGYKGASFLMSELAGMDTIFLKAHPPLRSEYKEYGDYTFLHDLFAKAAKTVSAKQLISKTYFSLETFIDTTQIEWTEAYYNGIYKGYEMDDQRLKVGRIALLPNGLKYFISLESSKAQYKHRVFETNYHFPKSPFEFSKKEAKLNFDLKLIHSFKDDEGETIVVVDFKPKQNASSLFEGRVWLDSLNGNVYKIIFQCMDAKIHPYDPILGNDDLIKADLYFTKTFIKIIDQMHVDAIEYNYQLHYEDWEKKGYSISTNTKLYAYDYYELFDLPNFDFGLNEENDYIKVNTAPYNAFFWEFIDEFSPYKRSEFNKKFILKGVDNNKYAFLGDSKAIYRLFNRTYRNWSKNRLYFEESGMKFNNDNIKSILASDKYNIDIQIFLDVNYLNDSLQFNSRAVFDPFDSFYYFEPDPKSTAFLNMYFDFVEIQRRKMDLELQKLGVSPQKAERIYKSKMVELARSSVSFFRELNRGNDKEGMIKWNEFILSELGINNWEIFELDYEFE